MSETSVPPIDSMDENERETLVYDNPNVLLNEFEKSSVFRKAVDERVAMLRRENPSAAPDLTDIITDMRGKREYIYALHQFYKSENNKLNFDMLPETTKQALQDYWDYVAFYNRSIIGLSLRMPDKDSKVAVFEKYDRERDTRHRKAAEALLGRAITDTDELTVARQLVSLLSEEKGHDKADPLREEKKLGAKLENIIDGH